MITSLKENEIFVFGSNLAGRHGKGAALYAAKHFGAERGIGCGPTGKCYAIPTKGKRLEVLPLKQIYMYVRVFIHYAANSPDEVFLLTRVGCGLAGYKDEDIAPLFKGVPHNVVLPKEWKAILKK